MYRSTIDLLLWKPLIYRIIFLSQVLLLVVPIMIKLYFILVNKKNKFRRSSRKHRE